MPLKCLLYQQLIFEWGLYLTVTQLQQSHSIDSSQLECQWCPEGFFLSQEELTQAPINPGIVIRQRYY